MARKFRYDQSHTLDIANRDGRTLNIELWKDGAYQKTLIPETSLDSVTLHTTQNPADDNHIPLGTGYKIRVYNVEDADDYDVLDFTFDMVDDNEQNVPGMPWPGDDGWEFSFSGKSYVESSDAVGSTPCDLYTNDPVNGVVGRLECKRPSNNASIPEYLLSQDTSADKPRVSIDANGYLYAESFQAERYLTIAISSEITNPGYIHLIACFAAPGISGNFGDSYPIFGREDNGRSSVVVKDGEVTFVNASNLRSDVAFAGLPSTPVVMEFGLSKDSAAGESWYRMNGGAKSYATGIYYPTIPAVNHKVLTTKDVNCLGYSFGMRIGEVTGTDYTNWYNYHADHAGLPHL